MAERDGQRPQLDFPQLTADLIADLRIRGPVGLLDFSDQVTPVFLIGSRNVTFQADLPAFNSAALTHGFVTNPAASTSFCSTGALPAGTYDLAVQASHKATWALNNEFVVVHRDAADAVTLATLISFAGAPGAQDSQSEMTPIMGYELAVDEILKAISPGIVAAGDFSCNIYARRRLTP